MRGRRRWVGVVRDFRAASPAGLQGEMDGGEGVCCGRYVAFASRFSFFVAWPIGYGVGEDPCVQPRHQRIYVERFLRLPVAQPLVCVRGEHPFLRFLLLSAQLFVRASWRLRRRLLCRTYSRGYCCVPRAGLSAAFSFFSFVVVSFIWKERLPHRHSGRTGTPARSLFSGPGLPPAPVSCRLVSSDKIPGAPGTRGPVGDGTVACEADGPDRA